MGKALSPSINTFSTLFDVDHTDGISFCACENYNVNFAKLKTVQYHCFPSSSTTFFAFFLLFRLFLVFSLFSPMKNKQFNLTSPYLIAKARVVSKPAFWFGKFKRSAEQLFCVSLPYSQVLWVCTFDK